MATRKYDGHIVYTRDDCSLLFNNDNYVFKDLKQAFKDGDKVTVEIKSRRKPRSLPQNAYLHLCLQMIADETGNTLDSVKSTLKLMYAKKPLLDRDGEPIYNKETGEQAFSVQDTHEMSTIEALEFTENVRLFAIEFVGLVIHEPNQNIKLNFR